MASYASGSFRVTAAVLLLLASLLAACPQVLAFGKGDRVTTRVHIEYPIDRGGRDGCQVYQTRVGFVGSRMRNCRLDIIWEDESGRKIVESSKKNCCIDPDKKTGFRKTYEATHTWSGNWKVRGEFHWSTDSGPASTISTPISRGVRVSTSSLIPRVRVGLQQA